MIVEIGIAVTGITAIGLLWLACEYRAAPLDNSEHQSPHGDSFPVFGAIPRADLPGARVSPLTTSAGELSDPFHSIGVLQ
jgi:hypothetical protein